LLPPLPGVKGRVLQGVCVVSTTLLMTKKRNALKGCSIAVLAIYRLKEERVPDGNLSTGGKLPKLTYRKCR
jgi:hypothetical protein